MGVGSLAMDAATARAVWGYFISRVFVLLIGVSLLGGNCDPPPDYPTRIRPIEAGTPADCKAACDHLRSLGCEEGNPTPKGATCEDVCNSVESSGTVTLDPGCVANIAKCEEIDACTYGS